MVILFRDKFAYELSQTFKEDLTSPDLESRLEAMRRLSRCKFDNSSKLLIKVADGYLSRTKSFEEEYPSEERSGVRGFFRRVGFSTGSVAEVKMNYSADEQLYAMR